MTVCCTVKHLNNTCLISRLYLTVSVELGYVSMQRNVLLLALAAFSLVTRSQLMEYLPLLTG